MVQQSTSTSWNDVVAGEEHWTSQVLLYLDDWDPDPPHMPANRASAFADLSRTFEAYVAERGETARTMFRRALHADIHRRFIHRHGDDDRHDPTTLYEACRRHSDVGSSEWAGRPLSQVVDQRLGELARLATDVDPDPDVMAAEGTNDVRALVSLAEQRRAVLDLLAADSHP